MTHRTAFKGKQTIRYANRSELNYGLSLLPVSPSLPSQAWVSIGTEVSETVCLQFHVERQKAPRISNELYLNEL